MKKLLVVLAAGLLVFGVAGQAKASFSQDDLIRVVYQTAAGGGYTYETASDLGNVGTIMSTPSSLVDAGYNLLSGNATQKFGSLNGLEVAYFAVNSATGELWTSGTAGASETNTNSSNSGGTITKAGSILAHGYAPTASSGGTANAWLLKSAANSYWKEMDGNSDNIGSFNNFYATGIGNGEIALVASGSVQQGLFHWATPGTTSTILSSLTLTTALSAAGLIQTSAITTASATPIPPSVLLLGSGLLGLVGIRRRNLFNF